MRNAVRVWAVAAPLAGLASAALGAGPLEAGTMQATKMQATNWNAIIIFAAFVAPTLGITYWAAMRTRAAKDFYSAGGGEGRSAARRLDADLDPGAGAIQFRLQRLDRQRD